MTAPLFEVGVMFHNNADLIIPFLYCFRRACALSYRLLAVDQGSTDETPALLKKELRPGVDIVSTFSDNRGIAAGRNEILRLRTPSLPLLLLDSDCFVIRDKSCDALLAAIQPGSPYAISFALQRGFYLGDLSRPGYSAAMFRPGFFEQVGPFDERFKMFCDDTVHYERSMALGIDSIFVSEAEVLHFWGSTTRAVPKWQAILAKDHALYSHERATRQSA